MILYHSPPVLSSTQAGVIRRIFVKLLLTAGCACFRPWVYIVGTFHLRLGNFYLSECDVCIRLCLHPPVGMLCQRHFICGSVTFICTKRRAAAQLQQPLLLFVSESLYRVKLCCTVCGVIAEKYAYSHGEAHRKHY